MKATLRLKLDNLQTIKKIMSSIEPDNKPLPKGMNIDMKSLENELVITIDYREDNILRLISTIDDILEVIKLSYEIISSFKR